MGKQEAQWGFCAVPCSVTQARSGSRCQKLAWKYCISPRGRGFQTIGSRVSFYFFFPLLSPKPSSPVSQASRFSSSTLHILAPTTTVFPTPALPTQPRKSCGGERGGTGGNNPSQEDPGGVGHLGAHPTCRSLNPIPACPTAPVPVSKTHPSEGKEDWRSRARGCSQTCLEQLGVTGEILAWCQQTARLQPPRL